jgi:hypothetical protein
MTNELTQDSQDQKDIVLSGAQNFQQAVSAQLDLNNFIASQMKEKVDFGIIPGTKKKSIWQPGAQKLLFFNGLGCRIESQPDTVVDFKTPFFNYVFKAIVFHKRSGKVVAECVGSANSMESRYRWQWVAEYKVPRGVNVQDLEVKEDDNGGKRYRIDNPDVYTLPNTLMKMAQKRAMIGASLLACRASENFTHDVEEEEAGSQAAPADKQPAEKQPESAGESQPARGGDTISEKQRGRFFAIWKGAKKTESEVKAYLKTTFGIEKSSDIPWRRYDEACKWAETKTAPAEAGDAQE